MKLNFTIRIPHRDMQKLVNLALESQIPEFSYEMTGEKGRESLGEVAEIRRILGIDDGSEFPNKLKSMYEDQILKLRTIAGNLGNEIDVTRAWFEQVKGGLLQTQQAENQKLKSLYVVLERELEELKKLGAREGEGGELAQKVAVLESEVRIKDTRIASLIAVEEQLRKTEFEKQNYQAEVMLLKGKLASREGGQASGVQLQRTRTIQQTTVTESVSKTVPYESSLAGAKTHGVLLTQLSEALTESKSYKTKCFELEFQLAQLRQMEEFLKIKTDEVDRLKKILDEQNAQIQILNRKNEENVRSIDRLNKKVTDLKENNAQLTLALDQKSEKNQRLREVLGQLELANGEAKLKNEALIKRINELEDEMSNAMDSVQERVVMTSQGVGLAVDHGRETVLAAQLSKRNEEIQGYLKALDENRKELAGLKQECAGLREADRQKELKLSQLGGESTLLSSRVTSLTESRDDAAKRLAKSQADLLDKDKSIQELERKILELQGDLDRAKSDLFAQKKLAKDAVAERDRTEAEKRALEAELAAANKALGEAKELANQLQLKIKELETNRQALQEVIKQYEGSNSPLKAERDALLAEKKKLGDLNSALQTENEKMKKEIGSLTQKVANLTSEREDLNKKLAQKDEKLAALTEENKSLKKSAQSLQDRVDRLTKDVERLTRDNVDKDATIAQLKAEVQRFSKESSELKAEKKRLELAAEEARSKFESLEKQVNEIIAQNATLTVDNRKLKEKLGVAEESLGRVRGQKDALQRAFEELELKYQDAHAQVAQLTEQLRTQVGELKRQNEALAARNGDLSKRVADLEAEVKAQREQYSEAVRTLNASVSGLKIDNNGLKTENDMLKRQLELLKADLEAKEREFGKALAGLRDDLEKDNQALADSLHKTEMESLSIKSERTALTQRVELLESELAAKETELDDIRSKNPKGTLVSPSVLEKLKEMNKLVDENRSLRAQMEAGKRRVELLEKDLQEKERQLAEALKNPDELLTPEMKDQLGLINKIKSDLFTISNENDQLRRKNELLEFENQEKGKYLEAANARVYPPNTIDMKDHLEAMGKANSQLSACKTEIEGLKRKALDQESQIESLRRQNTSEKELLEGEKKKLAEAQDQLQKANGKLRAELETLRKKFEEAQDDLKKLIEERAKLLQQVNQSEGQKGAGADTATAELTQKLAERDAALELAEKEKRNLKKTIEFLTEQVEALSKEPPKWEPIPSIDLSDQLKAELRDLADTKVELSTSRTQIEMLTRKMALLEGELEAKQRRLAELVGDADAGIMMKVADHQKIVGDLGAEIIRLQAETHGIQNRLDVNNRELEAQRADREALAERLRGLTAEEIPRLSEELNRTRAACDEFRAENQSMKRRMEIMFAENQGLNEKVRFLGGLVMDYSARLDALQRDKLGGGDDSEVVQSLGPASSRKVRAEAPVGLGQDPSIISSENAALHQKVAELQAFVDRKVPEYEDRIRRLSDAHQEFLEVKMQQIADLKAQLFQKDSDLEQLRERMEALKKENERLLGLLQNPDNVPKETYRKLAEEMAEALAERDRLRQKNSQLQQDSDAKASLVQEAENQKAKLAEALKARTDDVIRLEDALSKANQQVEALKRTVEEYERQLLKAGGGGGAGGANPVVSELRSALERAQKELEAAQFQCEQLTRQIQVLQGELQEKTKSVESLSSLSEELREKLRVMGLEKTETGKKIVELEQELAKIRAVLEERDRENKTLRERVGEGERELQGKNEALAAARSDVATARGENGKLRGELEEVRGQAEARGREASRLAKELQELENENKQLRERATQSEQGWNRARSELEELTSKYQQEKTRTQNLEKAVDEKDKKIASLEKRVQGETLRAEQLADSNTKLTQKVADLERRSTEAKQELEKAMAQLLDREQQLAKALSQQKVLEGQVEEQRAEVAKLKAKIAEYERELASLKSGAGRGARGETLTGSDGSSESEETRKRLEVLRKELQETQLKLSQKSTDLENSLSNAARLQADVQQRVQEVDRLNKEKNSLATRVKELATENDKAAQKISETSGERKQFQDELATTRQKLAAAEEYSKSRVKEVDNLQQQLVVVQKELLEVNSRLTQAQTELAGRGKDAPASANRAEELDRVTIALNKLRTEKESLALQCESLQRDLSAKDKQLEGERGAFRKAVDEGKELLAKLSSLGQENNSLKVQVEGLRGQVAKAKDDLDVEVSKSNQLREQVRKLESQLAQKDQDLSRAQTDISRLKEELENQRRRQEEGRGKSGGKGDSPVNQELLNKLSVANEEIMRLKAQVERLEKDVGDGKRQLGDAQTELAARATRIQALEKDLAEKNGLVSELRGELTKITAKAEVLEAKLKNLEQALAQKGSGSADRSSFLSILEKEIGSMETLGAELNKLRVEKEALERTVGNLQRDLAERSKEASGLKAAKEKAERSAQEQSDQASSAQVNLQKSSGELEMRSMKIRSLETELEQLRRRLTDQPKGGFNMAELAPELANITTVKNELNQVRLELQNAVGKSKSLEGEVNALRESNSSLQKRVATLTSELQTSQERAANASAAAGQFKNELDRLEFENSMLIQENKKIRDELQSVRTTLDQANAQNAAFKNGVEQLKAAISALESELKDRDRELGQATRDLEERDDAISQLQEDLKKVQAEKQAVKLEADRASRRSQALEEELGRLKSQQAAFLLEKDRLVADLAARERDLEAEQDKNAELKTEIEILKARLAEAEETDKERNAQSNVFLQSATSFRNVHVETTSNTAVESRLKIAENEYRGKLGDLERQVADLNEQLEEERAALAKAEKRLREFQAQSAEALRENGSLRSEVEGLNGRLRELEGEEEARQRAIATLNAQLRETSNQLKIKTSLTMELETQVGTLRDQVAELDGIRRKRDLSIERSRNTSVKSSVTNTSVTNTTLNLDMREYLAKLTALTSEANDLRFENETLKKKIRKAEEEEGSSARQVSGLNQTIDGLHQTLREKSAQAKQLGIELASLKGENESLKNKLRGAADEIAQNQRAISNLRSELESRQTEVRERISTINDLTDELGRARREVEVVTQKMSVSLRRNEDVSRKMTFLDSFEDEAAVKLREKSAENDHLRTQVEDLQRELEAAKRRHGDTDEELRTKDRRMKAAEQRADALTTELKAKNEAEFRHNTETMQLRSELESMRFKVSSLQGELEVRMSSVQQLSLTHTASLDATAREKQLSLLQGELSSVRAENDGLKRRTKSLEGEVQERDSQLALLQERLARLSEELNGARGQRADGYEVDRLSRKVRELEAELAAERENAVRSGRSSASYEVELRALRAEIDNFKNNKANLEAELRNKSGEIQKLKMDLQQAEQKLLVSQFNR